jgi:hypothetical protein
VILVEDGRIVEVPNSRLPEMSPTRTSQ